MYFPDYKETGWVYHIVPINDLKKIQETGISFNDKVSYHDKYLTFHQFIDDYRPSTIPKWVMRKKAIFATMNYKASPAFHSHTVILGVKINPKACWIANENRANQMYEPFVLKELEDLKKANEYLKTKGAQLAREYWQTSLSFEENLILRRDLSMGYDAEVLIMEEIPPHNIEVLYIVSDHRMLTLTEWKKIFCV